jgi:hypothetical protein
LSNDMSRAQADMFHEFMEGYGRRLRRAITRQADAVAAEREVCATVAEGVASRNAMYTADGIARLIRARSTPATNNPPK